MDKVKPVDVIHCINSDDQSIKFDEDTIKKMINQMLSEGCCGRMVKASGWRLFDCQFEPYPRAKKAAPLWCSLGCRSESDGRIHQ